MWEAGKLLQAGKYRIERVLGRGGFGFTYLATDVQLENLVVIKVPNQTCERDQDYEKFIRRFQREGQTLRKIKHPNVVKVIELSVEQGIPCLVMEYVEGETLSNFVRSKGKLAQDQAVEIFRKLAIALHHKVHKRGIIHCDLHPGNIIIQPTGEPVLIDFGSTKLLEPTTFTVTTTHNKNYTPYEQHLEGSEPKIKWDVYGLAATLFFAVTGQKPDSAYSRKLSDRETPNPQEHCPSLSNWLNLAILSGMELEPENRTDSIRAWSILLYPPGPAKILPRQDTLPWASHLPQKPISPLQVLPPIKSTTKKIDITEIAVILEPALTATPLLGFCPPLFQWSISRWRYTFPWQSLAILSLGYVPNGILLGLTDIQLVALTGIGVEGTFIYLGVWAFGNNKLRSKAWILSCLGAFSGIIPLISLKAFTLALTWALSGILAGFGSLTGIWDLVENRRHSHAKSLVFILILFSSFLCGDLISDRTNSDIWISLSFGFIISIQFWLIVVGLCSIRRYEISDPQYRWQRFISIGLTSVLGLLIGGQLGWWLKLSGFQLPSG